MWPEPYATVAAARKKGLSNLETAAATGQTVRQLQNMVREWNRKNPRNPLPRTKYRRTARYAMAADLYTQGKSRAEIAAIMQVSEGRAGNMLTQARDNGLLERRKVRAAKGGAHTYKHYFSKGAAPKLGGVAKIIDTFSADEVHQLLDLVRPGEEYLSDALARIVKEHLRDNQKGR